MNTPLIKWTGSKRNLAPKIISFFPKKIKTYYEPFVGGGSVFFKILIDNIHVKRFEISDKNESLIDIFNIVKTNPRELIVSYRDKWDKLQKNGGYYYFEREKYNKTKDPFSFYFLTRTCYNGTIRYNKNGNFNTPFHFGRPGMHPDKIEKIINYYSELMIDKDISFKCSSFEDVSPENENDVIYLDPPYTNTKTLYFGNIDFDNFLIWLNKCKCSWFLNINNVNASDNEENISIHYTGKELLNSGKSSFSRMKGNDVFVGEYFYYKLYEKGNI